MHATLLCGSARRREPHTAPAREERHSHVPDQSRHAAARAGR